ncbi:MAG TPA: head-tail connector protein [Mesorhizobium sp.]
MTLIRTVGPTAEPVTLAEMKLNMRLDHDTDDDLIGGLIRAAREDVERSTGLALIDQNWRLVLDRWPRNGCATIPVYPVREILSVTAYGAEGEACLIDPATYLADTVSRPARLHFEASPRTLRALNGIEIDFVAGYGEAGVDVPDLLKRAIALLVLHWYEFRTAFGPDDQPVSYPQVYERMIAPFRARRL